MTLKHFPGGGPQQLGLYAHYTFGKDQFYTEPSGRYGFDYHLRPSERAIKAGVGSIMPYYGVPVDARHKRRDVESIGMAFSRQIVTGILRDELRFKGYVNSDSGIIEERGWGLEDSRINPAMGRNHTVADRTALAIRAGTDVLSEFLARRHSGAMREIGDQRRVILNIYFRQPYVLDAESGLRGAGAILASFGASDTAQIDVLTGFRAPAGRLPFALPVSLAAVDRQHSDAPGYGATAQGALYPHGFGLTYR
jgi:hypothetical protein